MPPRWRHIWSHIDTFFKNPSFSQYPFVQVFFGGGSSLVSWYSATKNHKSFLCRLVLRLSGCLYLCSSAVCVAGLTHYSAVCRHRLKACGLDGIGIWDIFGLVRHWWIGPLVFYVFIFEEEFCTWRFLLTCRFLSLNLSWASVVEMWCYGLKI